jgi:hypothetical protein
MCHSGPMARRMAILASAIVICAGLAGCGENHPGSTGVPAPSPATTSSTVHGATGGSVNVYLGSKDMSPNPSAGGIILFTGAIGDYGRTTAVKGQTALALVKLQKGTFELKGGAALTNARTLTRNSATCSYSHSESVRLTVLDGTGLYARISGTLNITVDYARVDRLHSSGSHKGQCNLSLTAVPNSQFETGIGTGTVSFS